MLVAFYPIILRLPLRLADDLRNQKKNGEFSRGIRRKKDFKIVGALSSARRAYLICVVA